MSHSRSRSTVHAIAIAIAVALPLIAVAQSSNPPRVPPSNPPPICNTGAAAQCPPNPRIDTYDPATCPSLIENKDGTLIMPSGLLCREEESTPIAHINCWDLSNGVYDCKGEPLSTPGRLTYGWTVSSELRAIGRMRNGSRSDISVACVSRFSGPAVGYLTLTVVTDRGKVGTATQALNCN